jgi:hypothetical protein
MRWAGHIACMGEKRNAYSILAGKLEGKTTLGRTRCRWEDNIKMCFREIGWGVCTEFIWLRIETSGRLL